MKIRDLKLTLGILILSIFASIPTLAQTTVAKRQAFCEQGGQKVLSGGVTSNTTVQKSYPSCVITVYISGGSTLATLYSDAAGTIPKANPLTADSNGFFTYYASPSNLYDEQYSGGVAPNNITNLS